MKFGNLFKIALKALNNNKMRCFLTMLGVIIGVASVITMLAIGQGSKDSIKAQISEMGSNMIMIHPGNMQRGGVRQSADDTQSLEVVDFQPSFHRYRLLSTAAASLSTVITTTLRQYTESLPTTSIYERLKSLTVPYSPSRI